MNSITAHTVASKHPGPPLWLLAILYTVLFIAGLFPVTMYGGLPYWPGPWETPAVITAFFQTHKRRASSPASSCKPEPTSASASSRLSL